MTSTFKKNDWKPVLKGDVYCSPACGFNCTKAAYDKAHADADALVARLGKGWKKRVWENGTWHYEVTNGLLEMHVNDHGDRGGVYYSVWYQAHPQIIGAHRRSPEMALKAIKADLDRKRLSLSLADKLVVRAQRAIAKVTS